VPEWLFDRQRELVEGLLRDLGTYVDSCNFSLGKSRPAPTPEQERAWLKALRKVGGYTAGIDGG
jgi:hypothetical protein